MAIYAIGDVQGCYESLLALVDSLPLKPDDQIWLAGDLVNRGPKSAEVLRWAMGQGESVKAVLGNHDLHLLSAAAGGRVAKKRDTFQDVLQAEDSESLLAWLRSRPLLHHGEGHVLVHAGLHPSWSVKQAKVIAAECHEAIVEDRWLPAWLTKKAPPWSHELVGEERLASALSILVGIRTVRANHSLDHKFKGAPDERAEGTEPWYAGREDKETILFGHWAALGLSLRDKQVCLDSGCVWGNALTALRLHDRKIYSQQALERQ